MVNGVFDFGFRPYDLGLEPFDTIVQLLDRQRIEILFDERAQRIVRSLGEKIVSLHSC